MHKEIELIFKDEVYAIVGAAIEVHRELGYGFLEELKAIDKLTSREEGQLLNYLKATKLQVGLLINFGSKGRLDWKRMVM
ncbi:MAG: GxxExxY protein [Acidobacteriota bacterium]|nr:MAG: GxxExxY protein [Acidobacteriota bacterium]